MNLQRQEGDKNVLNLSKHFIMSPTQFALLSRGLTFIPTKGTNRHITERTRFDLQQYHRSLKLAAYFEHKKDSDPPPFIPKSRWSLPESQLPPEILKIIKADLTHFDTRFRIHDVEPNLNQDEIEALDSLIDNPHIIIKPADKGSAVVIMDREQYLWEGYKQLNDTNYYSKLTKLIHLETVPLVEEILKSLYDKKFITFEQKMYLAGTHEPRPRLFYRLPKTLLSGANHMRFPLGDPLSTTAAVKPIIQLSIWTIT